MIWQDLVFAGGASLFSIALIPTIRSNEKPPLATTVPTALALFVFSATSLTLDLFFTAVTQVISACLLSVLAVQQYTKHKR